MTAPFRYKKLGYIALNVSDLAKTAKFCKEVVGLQFVEKGVDGEQYFRCSGGHHDVVLHRSDSPGLRRQSWEMESEEDLNKLLEHCNKLNLNPEMVSEAECKPLQIERAFRIRDPHSGIPFEFYSSMQEASGPFEPTVGKILRLGHLVLAAKNYEATRQWLVENLNFKVSDYFDDHITFMRAFPVPYHHSFALVKSETGENHLHHIAFMVEDIDDIGKLYWRMKRENVDNAHGPGRHPPSQSICQFFFDDDRHTWEYTLGMEEFPEVDPREARRLSAAPENWDVWGAEPEPGFGESGTVA